jgi:hypothetical protein
MPEVHTAHHTTVIDGYRVELELYTESGEPRSDCSVFKDNFSSSLNRLDWEGTLYDANWRNEITVDRPTIDKITEWAESHGY